MQGSTQKNDPHLLSADFTPVPQNVQAATPAVAAGSDSTISRRLAEPFDCSTYRKPSATV